MALGYMRRHRRWLYGFLWVVIIAFIAFYVPAFLNTGKSEGDIVARVGKRSISVREFQDAFREQLRQYQLMSQGQRPMDADTAKRYGLPERLLDQMTTRLVVAQEAARLGLSVDDQALKHAILTSPQFQVNGRFMGAAQLNRVLEARGMSEEQFLESYRSDLVARQLEALVTSGIEPDPSDVKREYERRNEKAKVEYVLVAEAPFLAESTATDEEIKARFESQRESYRFPERRVISYLLVDRQAVRQEVSVTPSEIQTYYDDHSEEFTQPEQVCASHILIKVKTDPLAKEGHTEAEARTIAEGLLAQLKKGADFTQLAKKSSEDEGSASNGGSLGCFGRGQMVPEFEQAAFAMKPGETSDLVKSSFGFHIIRVISHQPETVQPLAAVKDQIQRILQAQATEKRLETKVSSIATKLRKSSLDEAAAGAGLKVQKTAPVARGAAVDPLSPAAIAAAFELQPGKVSTEPFRVPRGIVFLSVAEVQPPRLPELKEVQDQVRHDVLEAKALARTLDKARELRTRAEREGLEKAAKALGLTRKETPGPVNRGQALGDLGAGEQLDAAVYSLPEKTLSEPIRVAAGYAVLSVTERTAFDPTAFEKEKSQIADSLRNSLRNEVFDAYLNQARRRFPVERTEAFRTALGE